MAFITQSLIDNLDATSSPDDVMEVILQLIRVVNGNISTTDMSAGTRIPRKNLAQPYTLMPFGFQRRDIATGKTFDDADIFAFEVPENLPPITIFAGTVFAATTAVGGSVRLFVRRGSNAVAAPITVPVVVEATNTTYEIPPFDTTVFFGDIVEIRVDTRSGTLFDSLGVTLTAKVPMMTGP